MEPTTLYAQIHHASYPEECVPDYQYNPSLSKKSVWTPLGDKLTAIERQMVDRIPNDHYFTIRLDGRHFGTVVEKLQLLMDEPKDTYSPTFETIMKQVALKVATFIPGVLCVFTQSDEITLLFDRASLDKNGNPIPRHFNGRTAKLISLFAAETSNLFTREWLFLIANHSFQIKFQQTKQFQTAANSIAADPNLLRRAMDEIFPCTNFDARIGIFPTYAEAFEMILWRAQDCAVNGVSTMVHQQPNLPNKKQLMSFPTEGKVKWLSEQGLLKTATSHQLYGSFFTQKTFEEVFPANEHHPEPILRRRKRFALVEGPVIRNVKEGVISVRSLFITEVYHWVNSLTLNTTSQPYNCFDTC